MPTADHNRYLNRVVNIGGVVWLHADRARDARVAKGFVGGHECEDGLWTSVFEDGLGLVERDGVVAPHRGRRHWSS